MRAIEDSATQSSQGKTCIDEFSTVDIRRSLMTTFDKYMGTLMTQHRKSAHGNITLGG